MPASNDLAALRKRPGEPILASDWNRLLLEIDRLTPRAVRGERLRRLPEGYLRTSTAGLGSGALPATPLKVRLTTTPAGAPGVTVGAGLVGGVEPRIDDQRVSAPDDAGLLPVLPLNSGDFDPEDGTCRIHAVLNLDPGTWDLLTVEVRAFAARPAPTPWTAFKLLALVTRADPTNTASTLSVRQAVHWNLGYVAANRQGNGNARHWFWAVG